MGTAKSKRTPYNDLLGYIWITETGTSRGIKHDLAISDTPIGLLQGLAFALFYTIMGLSLGRPALSRVASEFPKS